MPGLSAGLAAFHSGAGTFGALIVGVLAGGATLAIGQIVFITVRTPLVRAAVGLLYAMFPPVSRATTRPLELARIGVVRQVCDAFAVAGAGLCWRHQLGTRMFTVHPAQRPGRALPLISGSSAPSRLSTEQG